MERGVLVDVTKAAADAQAIGDVEDEIAEHRLRLGDVARDLVGERRIDRHARHQRSGQLYGRNVIMEVIEAGEQLGAVAKVVIEAKLFRELIILLRP